MGEFLKVLSNIKGGPMSTLLGVSLLGLGGYLIWTYEGELSWTSVELGLLSGGVVLLAISDKWINRIFGINER